MIVKHTRVWLLVAILTLLGLLGGYWIYRFVFLTANRTAWVMKFIRNPDQYTGWTQKALNRCNNAPFISPTDGFIGFLWEDSFRPFHRHQGVDIFGGGLPGITPVYSVTDGYLNREVTWKSSLIIRVPSDPLQPGRQIWVYYTHLADPEGTSTILSTFPPGTSDIPIRQGDLLGYQGNYSGNPGNPVGVHLHISVLKDDGQGHYLNELKIKNTLDPSGYFGLSLNAIDQPSMPVSCP